MATSDNRDAFAQPQPTLSPMAALLSYLVPGLGQIAQGRFGKGLLFFVCLYGLFFFGEYLGNWRNVYIADSSSPPGAGQKVKILDLIVDRSRFLAQFWIGVAAWPAIIQHFDLSNNPGQSAHPTLGTYQRRPTEEELNNQLRNSDKSPDLGWMYTVIAGVLNILVIYDALAGPAYGPAAGKSRVKETAIA
jgi:hypothetical protein